MWLYIPETSLLDPKELKGTALWPKPVGTCHSHLQQQVCHRMAPAANRQQKGLKQCTTEDTARDSHEFMFTCNGLQGPVENTCLSPWASTEPKASMTTAGKLPSYQPAAAGDKQHTSVLMRRCRHIAIQENKSIRSPQPMVRHFARMCKRQGKL